MKKTLLVIVLFVSSIFSFGQNEGLVGWYPFNGNAIDESGNGNNGVVYGATLTADRFGNGNSAYQFSDSFNNYIKLNLNQPNITAYSISAWVKTPVGGTILSGRGDCNLLGTGLTLYIYDDSTDVSHKGQIAYIADGPNNQCGKRTPNTFIDNNWHHIVGVYSGSVGLMNSDQFSIYVDGVLIATNPVNLNTVMAPINQLDNLIIGNHHCWDSGFDGVIDDIRIYNRALSESDIDDIINENFAPTIFVEPISQTACQGESQIAFNLSSNGSAPLHYQWYKDGSLIANAQQSSYSISEVQLSDAGAYYCIVTNDFGVIYSSIATLTVHEVQPPTIYGKSEVLEWSAETYSVNQAPGSIYEFSVINGNILDVFPNYIVVQWGAKGIGQVICKETTTNSCTSQSSILEVSIGSLGLDEIDVSEIVISPNPATSNIKICSDVFMNKVEIYNSSGKKIMEKVINDLIINISLSNIEKGTYYFSIISDDKIVNRKVIIN